MSIAVNRPVPRTVTVTSLSRELPLTSMASTAFWIRCTWSVCCRTFSSRPSTSTSVSGFMGSLSLAGGCGRVADVECADQPLELRYDGGGLGGQAGAGDLHDQAVGGGVAQRDREVHLRLDQLARRAARSGGRAQPQDLRDAGRALVADGLA